MKTYQLYIDGQFVDPVEGSWFESIDPYRGEPWARIPRAGRADVDRAVAAAKRAMWEGPWATMTATARGKVLRRIGDLVEREAKALAEVEVRDNGKLFAEMYGQTRYQPEWWWYYAGLADKVEGAQVPIDKPETFAFTRHEPVGVVGALTAWNSPLLFVAWKCAPALAAGCAVVVKPSEFASASTLEFARLTKEAGLPDGMFNVITGFGGEAGSAIVEHPDVAKITFTGSDVTGAKVYEAAARQIKRVSLELGGKSPNIVFDDCFVDDTVKGVISGIFAATGQTCIAGSRLLLQRSIHDQFVDKLVAFAKTARMGDPASLETQVGPVTTIPQYEKVLSYIDVAKGEGAETALGGAKATRPECGEGWFVEPTIFTGVDNQMRIAQEEVFGPVLSVIPFDDEEEAVAIANDINFGLAAGVWTQNMGRAIKISERLRAGTVWVNTYRAVSFMSPFGGYKRSGLGRENGQEMIKEYLQQKSVWIATETEVPNPFVLR